MVTIAEAIDILRPEFAKCDCLRKVFVDIIYASTKKSYLNLIPKDVAHIIMRMLPDPRNETNIPDHPFEQTIYAYNCFIDKYQRKIAGIGAYTQNGELMVKALKLYKNTHITNDLIKFVNGKIIDKIPDHPINAYTGETIPISADDYEFILPLPCGLVLVCIHTGFNLMDSKTGQKIQLNLSYFPPCSLVDNYGCIQTYTHISINIYQFSPYISTFLRVLHS